MNDTSAANARMLLATDLDGTFLAGDPEAKVKLYQTLSRREDVLLSFVTGRGLESVLPLLADPTIPTPDFIICDVGATIVTGHDLLAVEPIQQEIAAKWPGELTVLEKIGDRPGLVRQNVPQDRRVSYFCDPEAVTDDLAPLVAQIGCDLLYSASHYLDVLPGGINKGHTVTKLVEHLGIPKDRVLVAGDTLNDLSMYDIGFPGVCVGEAEDLLLDATRDKERTFHATAPGTGGILQAISHFNLLDDEHIYDPENDADDPGKSDLVMVYHRLPYDEVIEDGEVKRRRPKSPNGIIPTLLSFFTERTGSWVAWSIDDPKRGKFATHTVVDPKLYPGLVGLPAAAVEEGGRRLLQALLQGSVLAAAAHLLGTREVQGGGLEGLLPGQQGLRRAGGGRGGVRRHRLDPRLQPVDGAGLPAGDAAGREDRVPAPHPLPRRGRVQRGAVAPRDHRLAAAVRLHLVPHPPPGRELRRRGPRRGAGRGDRDRGLVLPASGPTASRWVST